MTLHQLLGIIIGADLGTTITGQIIRLLDLDASGGSSWLRLLPPSSLACIVLLFPMLNLYEKASRKIVKDVPESEDKYKSKLEALSLAFYNTPVLALPLLKEFDQDTCEEVLKEEDNVDRITDRVSRYIVDLLPYR